MSELETAIHRELVRGGAVAVPGPAELAELVRHADPLRPAGEVARSISTIRAHLAGFGPLEPLLADPAVSDVMVNGPGPVWVERSGVIERTDLLVSREQIDLVVERILAPLGRRVDPLHALVDARLPDGSRVHVVVPPLAVDGPCVTIRRFTVQTIPLAGFAPPEVSDLLRCAVAGRANVVVSGATGSGKTTLLNALAAEVSRADRIVTIEDAAELRLAAPHVVRLESRLATADGVGEVTVRELVRNALRMRPDRIVVGEVRGPEAFDLLTALSTGHAGSLSTIHANSAADALDRLETLVLTAGTGLPLAAVRAQVAAAVDLIVHVGRAADGLRRVDHIAEVVPRSMGSDANVSERRSVLVADGARVLAAPVRPWRQNPGHGTDQGHGRQ